MVKEGHSTNSILNSIKSLLGLQESYTAFDSEIISLINSAIAQLCQIGLGPEHGFAVTSKDETWTDLLGYDQDPSLVKSYVHLKVKLIFDPPVSSFVLDALKKEIEQLEWRIQMQAGGE